MKNKFFVLSMAVASLMSMGAYAGGTYYNGNMYSSSQRRNSMYASSGQSYSSKYGYNRNSAVAGRNVKTTKKQVNKDQVSNIQNKKLKFDLGLNHEFANWKFDMNEAGSILSYDNLRWNVLDAKFAYQFDNSMRISAGGKYGWQFGESPMIDDDITRGGMWDVEYGDVTYSGVNAGLVGHALSRGTSKGGSQLGFNADVGFTFGSRIKFTPAVGYRYFKYKLTTENNYGVLIDTVAVTEDGDAVGIDDGTQYLYYPAESLVSDQIDFEYLYSTYYEQLDKSHEYNVLWHGPYVAMDMDYYINNNNSVNLRAELGLPLYKSEADQPYRTDLAHPKSFEDKGDFGKAIHVGLGANWLTALTDSLSLSVGLTYDYYKVNGATAITNMSTDFEDRYNELADIVEGGGTLTDAEAAEANYIVDLYESCNGWSCETKNEINSIYKSMGIRVGLEAKF